MNTITDIMPAPVADGKAQGTSKGESGPGSFGEILKTQDEHKQESLGPATDKQEQEKEMPGGLQPAITFPIPAVLQILAGALSIVPVLAPDGTMPQETAEDAEKTAVLPAVVPEEAPKMAEGSGIRENAPRETAGMNEVLQMPKDTEPGREVKSTGGMQPQHGNLGDKNAEFLQAVKIHQEGSSEGQPRAEVKETGSRMAAASAVPADGKNVAGNTKRNDDVNPADEANPTGKLNGHPAQESLAAGYPMESAASAEHTPTAMKEAVIPDIRPEYMEQLKANIADKLAKGRQEFEIQLNPANLGKLVIKATYEAGKAVISIVCSEARTVEAMSQQARELAAMVQDRTGSRTDVIVEHPAGDYLQQEKQQENHQGNQQEGHSGNRQNENKKSQFHENFDFLQQLRLGLA